MSRIQDILNKAQRDGTVRRTRGLADDARGPHPFTPAPRREATPPPAIWPAGGSAEAPTGGRTASDARLDSRLVAATASHSYAAEQFRALRTRIKHAENGRAARAILVTSPAKGDGKSLTAANLALTMAQELHQRVLLVDGDLRRPAVHRLFGVPDGPGVSDVLSGRAELDDVIVTLPDHSLSLLPAGSLPHHPAELLGSASMRRLLDTLRSRYDRVLIDMPPVAPLADLHIVAPMADGVLMIVRAGVTPKPAIERALAGLDTSRVLGLVLNETGGHAADRDTYEGYGYLAG